MKMVNKIKSLIGSVAVALALAGCATPKNSSLNVFPAYNAKQKHYGTIQRKGRNHMEAVVIADKVL
jgi:outer membrane lipoprotein SlyB